MIRYSAFFSLLSILIHMQGSTFHQFCQYFWRRVRDMGRDAATREVKTHSAHSHPPQSVPPPLLSLSRGHAGRGQRVWERGVKAPPPARSVVWLPPPSSSLPASQSSLIFAFSQML